MVRLGIGLFWHCSLSSRGTMHPDVSEPGLLPWLVLGELCWAWLNLPHMSHVASPIPHHLGWKYLLLGSGSSLLIAQFTVLTYTFSQSSLSVLGFIILFLPKAFSLHYAMLNPGCLLHLTIRMANIMVQVCLCHLRPYCICVCFNQRLWLQPWLVSFIQHSIFKNHPWSSMYQYFILFL